MGFLSAVRSMFRRRGRVVHSPMVNARYDAAQSSGMNTNHWGATDALDADASNSKAVRQSLYQRSRYETANNGYGKGIVLTQANYVVGRGPKLRMQSGSTGFNAMVEAKWTRWAKAVKLARKLRTAIKAKVVDGESFVVIRTNPGIRDEVKIDLVPVECDQVTTPYLGVNEENAVDGIDFDAYGNRTFYRILKQHPGSSTWMANSEAERVPAEFVCHLFREDRPGQQRAVPEITSTLNLFAVARRFREATVVSAENIANFSLFLKTQGSGSGEPDEVSPFATLPIEKGMMTALPFGHDAFQPKPEQPAASYDSFTRATLCEEARPLNMPYNIAACDSSGYSFSGGRLDHLTYFVSVDVEQAEIEDPCLEQVFALWFSEAVRVYGWSVPSDATPTHGWDWPARPQIDDSKTATARKTNLSTGATSLRRTYAEDGLDFEDELTAMAEDYGKTVDEMRAILLQVNLLSKSGQQQPADDSGDDGDQDDLPPMARSNGSANGNGRMRV